MATPVYARWRRPGAGLSSLPAGRARCMRAPCHRRAHACAAARLELPGRAGGTMGTPRGSTAGASVSDRSIALSGAEETA